MTFTSTAGKPGAAGARVVAVTGASGYIGARIVKRLVAEPSIARVIGIDIKPSHIEHLKLTSLIHDVTEPLGTLFKRAHVDTVVHLAFVLRQLRNREESRRINVGGASSVLGACEVAGVSRIVLMSSATVYGPHSGNTRPLLEDAPLRPPSKFNYASDKSTVERLYRNYGEQRLSTQVSILRGCVVMGPMVDNFITQALKKPALVAVGRDDPEMQFVHEEDLTEILWRFVSEPHPGTFNVAGSGSIPWSQVVKMARKRLLRFSAPVAYGLTNLTWRLRLQNDAPGAGLDYIRWPWVVSTARLENELEFKFKYSSYDALESYLGPQPAMPPIVVAAPLAPNDGKDSL